ncbi:hypothetical protein H072_1946 [Dactylellina haptotyla CBS 200.50]|uniref:MARVEL domain-containing protein n=1 Tax=Dactylellina haptotyla (strain CBS 200.50) TaxID=1284197 RepID=S8AST5_DACHA|nr:hypothetical protein H072_1946 [Dactylellina haptotyla CBS 200.50]
MADPSMNKPPIVESVVSPELDSRSMNVTPAPTESPIMSPARPGPSNLPEYQRTVHRPPPSTISSDPSDPDDDYKTININITIKIPSSFRFPCFRRCKRRGRDGAPPQPRDFRSLREGDGIPPAEKKRRALAVLITLFYISFIVCGAVSWGLKNRHGVWEIPHAPLIIETFIPILDFFVLLSTIFVIKRHREEDKPSVRYVILILLNLGLFILHLVIMILAVIWHVKGGSGYYRGYYWMWVHEGKLRTICALILYSTVTMMVFKIIALLAIIRVRSLRGKFTRSVTRIPEAIAAEYGYQRLTHDVDDDAPHIDNVRNPAEQRGRVFLD